jgi:AraC-like DNA-binding protein
MARLIRSAVLTDYVQVAKAAGLDPYRLIAKFGLPAACLTDPEVKVSAAAVGRVLEESARQSGREDFGLMLAERRTLANLGAVALLVREQPTIRKALETLVGYMFLHSESLSLRIDDEDDLTVLRLMIEVGRPVPIRQAIDLGIGFLHRSLQQLLRESWRPRTICFTHARPTGRDTYRRFFRTSIEYDQEFNGIVCATRDLEVAVPAADQAMARQIKSYLDTLASRENTAMAARVRECIYMMLPSGLCSADHVAQRLGVDRRTVHRHLAREKQTFSSIVDSVRAELVTRHVENSDRPLTSVAELLGFSALSAFSRWFRAEFGCSVTQWRAARTR